MMERKPFTIFAPATSANLGPGFDCLGLALDLWNETEFSFPDQGIQVEASGYPLAPMPAPKNNLIIRSFQTGCSALNAPLPPGISLRCINRVPAGSGLGSSSAAIVTGLCAAFAWAQKPLDRVALLSMATALEGHPDNVAPAIYGGLTAATLNDDKTPICLQLQCAPWHLSVAVPRIVLSTVAARAALPKQVPLQDAVFNIGHTLLTAEALKIGDGRLLGIAMRDRLHQPYRLPLIPSGEAALKAAIDAGAVAAVVSGAGPGLIAFCDRPSAQILSAMRNVLENASIAGEYFTPSVSPRGAYIRR